MWNSNWRSLGALDCPLVSIIRLLIGFSCKTPNESSHPLQSPTVHINVNCSFTFFIIFVKKATPVVLFTSLSPDNCLMHWLPAGPSIEVVGFRNFVMHAFHPDAGINLSPLQLDNVRKLVMCMFQLLSIFFMGIFVFNTTAARTVRIHVNKRTVYHRSGTCANTFWLLSHLGHVITALDWSFSMFMRTRTRCNSKNPYLNISLWLWRFVGQKLLDVMLWELKGSRFLFLYDISLS